MTPGCGPPDLEKPEDPEAHEELLKRLIDAGASDERIGQAALEELSRLLDLEHASLAAWHACRYEAYWDGGRKLDILERMWRLGMESSAIQLCHRWKLSTLCHKTRHAFFREMFPKLPQRQGDPP